MPYNWKEHTMISNYIVDFLYFEKKIKRRRRRKDTTTKQNIKQKHKETKTKQQINKRKALGAIVN